MTCPACAKENLDDARFCSLCGTPLGSPTLQPGMLLHGRYRIARLIHPGNMGTVYAAADENVAGQQCAVKEMQDSYLPVNLRSQAAQRFMTEAEILARLRHPNIPFVKDFFTDTGRCYLVMELMEGTNLEEHLTAAGRAGFTEEEVIAWAHQLCDILHYLHSQAPPVVHRDIKPSNLILGSEGQIYLIDFGIAKVFTHQKKGTLIGTPGYAAPEQYRGEMSFSSDLYSLGVTIYELLTGTDPQNEVPFNLPDIQQRRPDISPYLRTLVTQLLRLNPHERPSGALQVQQMLRQAAEGGCPPPPSPPSAMRRGGPPSMLRRVPEKLIHGRDKAEMLLVPAGYFWMGAHVETGDRDEIPRHEIFLESFYIDRGQVTNRQFERFIRDTDYVAEGSWKKYYLPGAQEHPVVGVTFNDARSYACWAGKSLPSESEWEKAARGADGRAYPWGGEDDPSLCNNIHMKNPAVLQKMAPFENRRGTVPPGLFPGGRSPFGLDDMAGNVWEWTDSWYEPYPGNPYQIDDFGREFKVLRGGAWGDPLRACRCFVRVHEYPDTWNDLIGFRTILRLSD